MKLAICDDDKGLIDELKPFVYQYASSHRFDMAIDTYNSGEKLLKSPDVYDMIFLDYQMGGIDGMSAARKLRDRKLNSSIVFVTNYPDFVYNSFEVNPLRFIKKPVEKAKVYEAMDAYFKRYGNDYHIGLRFEGATVIINTQDIIFLHAMGKECLICMPKEQMIISDVMGNIIEMLPRSHFFKQHRGYCVNFNYISSYDARFIYMKSGQKLPISKRGGTPFKTAYKEYADLYNPKRRERSMKER